MPMTHRFIVMSIAAAAAWASPAAQAQGASAATPPATAAARPSDFIVAVVNSEPITNHEVQIRIGQITRQSAQQGSQLPSREVLAREVLDRLIVERIQIQMAKENGVKADDAAVDQAEQNVARQNRVEVAELRRRIAREGVPLNRFREDLRGQILLTRLRERELESRVKVSEVEIDQFLREQAAAPAAAPTEIELAQILVSVPEDANAQQVAARQARAQDVLKRVKAGEDFATLARAYSDAPERDAAGGLGLRSLDRYPQLFVDATAALAIGGVSELVRSGAGWHILKVLDKRQPGGAMSITQNHARHILLRVGPQLSEEQARERLLGMKRRLLAGQADFAALARASSQDGSSADGGDLGWSNPGQFVPEFEEVIDALAPGELSEPLVSRFGVHLIQLLERREYQLTPREQREMARGLVREKKLEEAYTNWVQELRARAYVELREPPRQE